MKKGKRYLSIYLFGIFMVLLAIGKPVTVRADEATDIVASGSWGYYEIVEWVLTSDGTLTISGSGSTASKYGTSYFSNYNVTEVVIEEGITHIAYGTFRDCANIEKVSLPTSLVGIEENAFNGCSALTSIEIPKNVVEISSLAFYNCTNVKEINVHQDNQKYSSIDGVLYRNIDNCLYKCPEGFEGILNIPSSTTDIYAGDMGVMGPAIMNCTKLTEVVLPANILDQIVGNRLLNNFMGCDNLCSFSVTGEAENEDTEYTIVDGALYSVWQEGTSSENIKLLKYPPGLAECNLWDKCSEIYYDAFRGSEKLTTVYLPCDISSIYGDAFSATSLTDIYYNGTEKQWEGIVVRTGNEELQNATIHYLGVNVKSISLDKTTTTLNVGVSETLLVTFLPQNASYKAISWEISDANIATVEDGVVTAVAPGTVTITATSLDSGCTATCLVEITQGVYGDANGDGEINTKDIILTRRHVAAKNPTTGKSTVEVEAAGDANGDGVINTKDIILIRRYVAAKDPVTGESSVVLGPNV